MKSGLFVLHGTGNIHTHTTSLCPDEILLIFPQVENFKKMNLVGNDAVTVNSNNNQKVEEPLNNPYWSFTARDSKEEMELTFDGVTDKRKVVVVFKNSSLYVEYNGKEWFGLSSSQIDAERRKKTTEDGGCTIEEIDDKVPENLKDLERDVQKRGALLWDAVDVEDCTWTIVDGTLQVTLCKAKEGEWRGVIKGEK